MFSANTSQVSDDKLFVEDVFSTYLYTGTGANQTVTNGIDLAGKGGLVWIKNRGPSAWDHVLNDTARGIGRALFSNLTQAEDVWSGGYITSYNSTGFTTGTSAAYYNQSGTNYASWTFRKAPKFFDVVTFTKNSSFLQNVPHSLGVAPGLVLIKATSKAEGWTVYHRSLGTGSNLVLNSTAAKNDYPGLFGGMDAETIGMTTNICEAGATYVAYLFAHDTTSDGIIQCGSFTTDGSGNATVNLGWEPQFIIRKASSVTNSWVMLDNMRGFGTPNGTNAFLYPNLSNAELSIANDGFGVNATGFTATGFGANVTFIYIAIRRGPMRTPTSGTSVFAPVAVTSSTGLVNTINFPLDLQFQKQRTVNNWWYIADRLRGISSTTTSESSKALASNDTSAEFTADITRAVNNTSFQCSAGGISGDLIYYNFRRAPSFFDEVCYTGTGAARTVNHNLGVAPELMIVKIRNGSLYAWLVYSSTSLSGNTVQLNKSDAAFPDNGVFWTTTAPTSTVFSLNDNALNNEAGKNFVAYLFASCPGVSKVGSYTGNGSSQTINCGFAAGARFVMIKRTDSTGDWYVWDTARGIVAGNDPRLSLNTTAAEVTTDDSVDTNSSGFVVNQLSATNINVSSATYIYLAVA